MTTNIFALNRIGDECQKINMDELYEGKRKRDLDELSVFNKILSRIHQTIKTASRQKKDNQFCWAKVPEIVIGVSNYNQSECIAYIHNKLEENGFRVKYYHPGLLLIAWNHWIPSYVRNEIKSKYGVSVNEYGQEIVESVTDPLSSLKYSKGTNKFERSEKYKKDYIPTKSYKPTIFRK